MRNWFRCWMTLTLLCGLNSLSTAAVSQTRPNRAQVNITGGITATGNRTSGFCSPIIVVNSGNISLNCATGPSVALQAVTDQITNLYSPLNFELVEGDAEWKQFTVMFQRYFGRGSPLLTRQQIQNGMTIIVPIPLAPNEWSVWTQWVQKAFDPRNDRINDLIRRNQRYVVGGILTPCMKEFLAYKQAFDHNREEAMAHADQRTWPVEQNWPTCLLQKLSRP